MDSGKRKELKLTALSTLTPKSSVSLVDENGTGVGLTISGNDNDASLFNLDFQTPARRRTKLAAGENDKNRIESGSSQSHATQSEQYTSLVLSNNGGLAVVEVEKGNESSQKYNNRSPPMQIDGPSSLATPSSQRPGKYESATPSRLVRSVSKSTTGFLSKVSVAIRSESCLEATKVPRRLAWVNDSPVTVHFVFPALAFLFGVLSVVYSVLSGQLGYVFHQGVFGSMIAYTGAGLLTTLVASTKGSSPTVAESCLRVKTAISYNKNLLAILIGGVIGAIYAVGVTYIAPEIGTSPWFVFNITGTMTCSLLFDVSGILWTEKNRPTFVVYVGSVCLIIGSIIFQFPSIADLGDANINAGRMAIDVTIAFVTGVLTAVQGASNRKLSQICGSVRRTAAFSFVSGTLVLAAVAIFVSPDWETVSVHKGDWYKFFAGIFAVPNNLGAFLITLWLGFSMYFCFSMAGQIICSLLVDSFGLMGVERRQADAFRIAGTLIVIVSVFAVQISRLFSGHKQRHLHAHLHDLSAPGSGFRIEPSVTSEECGDVSRTLKMESQISVDDVGILMK